MILRCGYSRAESEQLVIVHLLFLLQETQDCGPTSITTHSEDDTSVHTIQPFQLREARSLYTPPIPLKWNEWICVTWPHTVYEFRRRKNIIIAIPSELNTSISYMPMSRSVS